MNKADVKTFWINAASVGINGVASFGNFWQKNYILGGLCFVVGSTALIFVACYGIKYLKERYSNDRTSIV